MAWTQILTDARGRRLAEIRGAPERRWRRSLNRGRSSGCNLQTRNPLQKTIRDGLDTLLVKAYDDRDGTKRLRHVGPVTGLQRAPAEDGGQLTVNSSGPEWRLLARLIGKDVLGASFGTAVAQVDRGEVMGRIVDALNAGDAAGIYTSPGDTGIRRGQIQASTSSYFGPYRYAPASTAFADLAAGLDAPDFDFRPVEPAADALGVQIAALDVAPAFGAQRLGVSFECGPGTRANVPTFTETLDPTGDANDVVHLPDGFPDTSAGILPLELTDAASILERGLREAVVNAPGLVVPDFRTQLLNEHLRIRRVPRRTITFQPLRDLEPAGLALADRSIPRPFVDYDVGDVVRFRAVEAVDVYGPDGLVIGQEEVATVDAWFRIYVMEIVVDEAGAETVTLTFVEEA